LALSDEDVSEILRIIDSAELDELSIQPPAFSLHVVRRGATPGAPRPQLPTAAAQTAAAEPSATPPADPLALAAADPPASRPAPASGTATREIEAPMLGTFYRTESPSHPPFVEVGDHVAADSVVCLIEVMKLMNHIQAGVAGTIVEVLARSGELVEFGQPLFAVAPDA
jgi:acetyl-CoA carboxylase biotin carboxyl carrier protein